MEIQDTQDYSERVEYTLKKALAQSSIEQVEVFLGTNRVLTIRSAVGKILESKVIQDTGMGIRIVTKDHGMGFSSTCDFSDQAILRSIKEAKALARYRKLSPSYNFPTSNKTTRSKPNYDPHLVDTIFSYREINEQVNQTLQETIDYAPTIKEVGGPTHLVEFHKHVMNSNGVDISESGTYWSSELLVVAESATDRRDGSDTLAGWRLGDLDMLSLSQHAADMAIRSLGGKKIEPGKYEIIFSQVSVATFLQWLTILTLPQTQDKHMSLLKGRLNEQITSDLVTIGNDSLKIPCPVAGSYDDEGVPTEDLKLIQNGIFKIMPFDTIYANHSFTSSRGNGYRTGTLTDWLPGMTVYPGQLYQREPFPSLPAIYMEEGDSSVDEMVAETKKGIYLDFLDYAYITNGGTGDYSGILRQGTFLIENGKIKHPIQKCRLMDNILDMAQNIELVGSSRMAGHWVNMMHVPSIKIKQAYITPY